MSKLVGKKILEKLELGVEGPVRVRYLKESDSFKFQGFRYFKTQEAKRFEEENKELTFAEIGEKQDILVIKRSVLLGMIEADKQDKIVYRWSLGYKTKLRKENVNEIMFAELCWLESNYAELGCPLELDVDDYKDMCIWQHLFCISNSELVNVQKMWKKAKWGRTVRTGSTGGSSASARWYNLKRRSSVKKGRKSGTTDKDKSKNSQGLSHSYVCENLLEKDIAWNKKVALERGFLEWFLAACRDECELVKGEKWTKEKKQEAISEWKEKRKDLS